MRYQKTIKYLEYLENGTKLRTAGFAKIEIRDLDGVLVQDRVLRTDKLPHTDTVPHTVCNLYLQVNGFPLLENPSREVYLEAGEKVSFLDKLHFNQGRAELTLWGQDARRLGREALSYEELTAIRIPMGKGKELYCRWREVGEKILPEKVAASPAPALHAAEAEAFSESEAVVRAESLPESEAVVRAESPSEFEVAEAESLPEPEAAQEKSLAESEAAAEAELLSESEAAVQEEPFPESETAVEAESLPEPEAVPQAEFISKKEPLRTHPGMPPHFYEDKWQQLSSIYPHIAPFEDDRDYLSISPADFVVLQKQYHGLVSNSFLLHGYYNYGHLILARVQRLGQIRYYLGVPGNFYEKEKQVALLFGFESFECKSEPVRAGDFGYYCVRVDI